MIGLLKVRGIASVPITFGVIGTAIVVRTNVKVSAPTYKSANIFFSLAIQLRKFNRLASQEKMNH